MVDADVRRRVIGLLTLAYNASHDPEARRAPEEASEDFSRAVDSLMEGWGSYSVSYGIPVEDTVQEVMGQVSQDVSAMVTHFVSIFLALCQRVEHDCPDTDIANFLRQLGLDAAEDD